MSDRPETRQIELETRDGWLTIWLNRPQSRNALSTGMIEDLLAALRAVREDRGIRGITVRGRGGVFCAGGDIKEFKAVFQGELTDARAVAAANRRGGELFGMLNEMPQVVVMLVEGAAIAGGLGMLCAADVVVVTESAQFALTETALGIPPAQIAPFVAQRIGLPAARRLMLTGARFDGRAAGELGLADQVVDTAVALAAAEQSIRDKEILLAAGRLDRESLMQLAAERFAACMLSDEGREGVAAFVAKRPPGWSA
jgi:isohexenylglutaconyl-CoA hydratase